MMKEKGKSSERNREERGLIGIISGNGRMGDNGSKRKKWWKNGG